MFRMVIALVVIGLLCVALPEVTSAAEPPWPESLLQPSVVFDTQGPDSRPGVWTWNPNNFVGGGAGPVFWSPRWEWTSLDNAVTSDILLSGPPEWPSDPVRVQAIAGYSPGSSELGYWVWNPYRFTWEDEGPVFWSPTWLWVQRGHQLVLSR